jgi:hypothetical protein
MIPHGFSFDNPIAFSSFYKTIQSFQDSVNVILPRILCIVAIAQNIRFRAQCNYQDNQFVIVLDFRLKQT